MPTGNVYFSGEMRMMLANATSFHAVMNV